MVLAYSKMGQVIVLNVCWQYGQVVKSTMTMIHLVSVKNLLAPLGKTLYATFPCLVVLVSILNYLYKTKTKIKKCLPDSNIFAFLEAI